MASAATTYKFSSEDQPVEKPGGIGQFVWNSRTKQFLGRDGLSWAKISICYAIFYLFLAGFFIAMLAIFASCFMSLEHPTYFGESSVMNQAGMGLGFGYALNPGLGFRPQLDPEDNLIIYNPKSYESTAKHGYGFRQSVDNLRNFLEMKYPAIEDRSKVIKCEDGKDYKSEFEKGKACEYDYKKVFEGSGCGMEDKFGYNTNKPCVMVKLNKIYSWEPVFENSEDENKVRIVCAGETSVDVDNIHSIVYNSENNLNNTIAGFIDSKYYPFMSQPSYRQPFVMAQFDITPNMLVNVLCKGYAANIDNEDRRMQRGMTKFSLYIQTT